MSAPLRLVVLEDLPGRVSGAIDHAAVRRLHASGPRPVAELLREIAAIDPSVADFVHERLERYTRIPPEIYRCVGADDWRALS